MKTDREEIDKINRRIFKSFAKIYPHEAHEHWPEEFWEMFQRQAPGISRKRMEQILAKTAKGPK